MRATDGNDNMPDRMSPLSDREILVQIATDTSRLYDAVFGSQVKPGLVEDVSLVKARIAEFNEIYRQSVAEQTPRLREYYQVVEDVKNLKQTQVGNKEKIAARAGVMTAIGLALAGIIQGLTGIGER